MNKPANDDSISRVLPKKTNLCFLEALESLRFLLVRGCPRLGQPIEKPISPGPPGRGCRASIYVLSPKFIVDVWVGPAP